MSYTQHVRIMALGVAVSAVLGSVVWGIRWLLTNHHIVVQILLGLGVVYMVGWVSFEAIYPTPTKPRPRYYA